MLIDRVKIKVQAGRGGDGAVTFALNRKPSGGNGGTGGNVYIEGDRFLDSLVEYKYVTDFKAGAAMYGGQERSFGRDGDDIYIKVPLVTKVSTTDGVLIGTISEHGQRLLVANGGRGGLGNHHFKAGQVATLRKFTPGILGEAKTLILKLNLKADIIFIGLPNAGKSSLLNTLTNAKSKVAAYAFTTLKPKQGVLKETDIILLDLPGLIEGTNEGKGLGSRFELHTRFAQVVMHFISLESEDMAADYKMIRKELEQIEARLATLPEIIVVSKTDLLLPEEVKAKVKEFKKKLKLKTEPLAISVYDFDALKSLSEEIKKLMPQFSQPGLN